MTDLSIRREVQQWAETPFSCKEEKSTLLIITAVVLAIIALGIVCYYYVGGKFASIPGYNQNYAYFLWAAAGAIVLGTAISYLIKKRLSNPHSFTASSQSTTTTTESFNFEQLSFKDALTQNKGIKWLTNQLKQESITILSQEEETSPPFSDLRQTFYSALEMDPNSLLSVFEKKRSSLLAGRQSDTRSWFIAARVELLKDGRVLDGICLMTQNTLDGPSSTWWVHCKFFGLSQREMRQEFKDIVFDRHEYPIACQEFLWIKSVLEGKERGFLPLTFNKFIEDKGKGTVRLWQPAPL